MTVAALVFVLHVPLSQAEFIYAIQDDVLYQADPNTGTWTALSDTWAGTELLASCSGSMYAIQGDGLYKVDRSGSWTALTDLWTGTVALTGGQGWLYAAQNDLIYRIDPSNGDWETVPGDYVGTTHLAWAGGALIAGGQFGELAGHGIGTVEITVLKHHQGTTAMAGTSDALFVIQGDVLYRVDPFTGDYESLGGGYEGATELGAWGNHVYCVWQGSLWKTNAMTGEYESLGSAWEGTTALCIF